MTAGKQGGQRELVPIRASASPPLANAYGPLMTSSSVARLSKLQPVLNPEHGELVRAFVREASLAEAVPAPAASLIADDAVEAWQALCLPDSARNGPPSSSCAPAVTYGPASCCRVIRDFRMW